MRGINISDILTAKPDQLKDGRLEYRRLKTKKRYSIKVEPEAMAIIEKYRGKEWLLSTMDHYRTPKDYLQHMNKALKSLGKVYVTNQTPRGKAVCPRLSTYWARHTWATPAYEIGIPVDVIGQALGHSDGQHRITYLYIRMHEQKVDEANRKVLDYLKG